MQNLEIISVNLWQILISLCNLLLLFLILKYFLYKPVKKALAERKSKLDGQYERAKCAEDDANALKLKWEEKMESADKDADKIIKTASENANTIKENTLNEAKNEAARILRKAEADAEAEREKAKESIKKEIVDVSCALSEKVLEREISEKDQRRIIDEFISEMDK